MKTYQNIKVLVLGMGISGRSMVSFLAQRGAEIIGFDDRPHVENPPCKLVSSIDQVDFSTLKLIAFSPGVKETHPVFIEANKYQIPVIGEIELAARELKNPCLGITGTNGKSTVTTLVTHLLQTAKIKARALGNIGVPLTSVVQDLKDEVCVIELSSFQLEALKSPILDQSLLLNLSPDHLDRYASMKEYGAAKFEIQKRVKPSGYFYYEASLVEQWEKYFTAKKRKIFNGAFETFCSKAHFSNEEKTFFSQVSELQALNFSAALTLVESFQISHEILSLGLRSFRGLAHRCEYVDTIKNVHFYNDSKATNLDSVIKALQSFNSPIQLIMGGQDKGLDFSILLPYFKGKVKKIYAIGEVQSKIIKEFSCEIKTLPCSSLQEALNLASQHSDSGDTVLLSPACSSFDMFQNFEHRGNEFKKMVCQIKGEQS